MIALVDIDGTVADCGHRLHWITPDPDTSVRAKDWDSFFNACDKDSPIEPVCELVRAITLQYLVVWVTGRPHTTSEATIKWLKDNDLPYSRPLYMRRHGDHREDVVVKRELYEELIKPSLGEARLAIEDRDQVVAMWRSLGITTLQPKDGDY